MLKITNLQKKYLTDKVDKTALTGINLTSKPGRFEAIMGSSGCGEATWICNTAWK